jgi:16S rRNA (cytosine967-C5)-methyltransferase
MPNARPGRKRRHHPDGKPAPGLAARRIAAEAMRRVLRERRALDEALDLAGSGKLEPNDAALARAIATIAFRRLGTIREALAARLTAGTIPEAGILSEAMVTGAAQILFMDVPDHAAVDIAVELAKSDSLAMHFAPLVNAVLRRIATESCAIVAASDAYLSDTPQWLRERWSAIYGETEARAIADAHRLKPHVDLTPLAPAQALARAVNGEVLPTGSIRLRDDTPITQLNGYSEGAFLVQDAASALPARLVGAREGQRILDLCAAPGGKTAQLAMTGADVTAVERSAARAERIGENLARLRLDARIVVADAGEFTEGTYDAVLLDAPCSATGTIRRHPEIAWSKRLEDILGLARGQQRLLDHAADLVRPGGRLVYATCSLEPEEGERQIARVLAAHPSFAVEPVHADELGVESRVVSPEGFLRVLPSHGAGFGGMDGFFAARLHRAM